MADQVVAQVRVSKIGPAGRPVAEVHVDSTIGAHQLGAVLQNVATDERVLKAAGLRACGGCKSGLDINILDRYQDIIEVKA
jgi:hypothetical protein